MNVRGEPDGAGEWSLGAAAAWRIAAAEAQQQQCSEIEPLHLLIGLCSIKKALADQAVPTLRAEYNLLSKLLVNSAFNEATIRRAARAEILNTRRGAGVKASAEILPSEAAASVLDYAGRLARESNSESVGLTHLLTSLLECPDSPVPEFLSACRIDVPTFNAAAKNALSGAFPDSDAGQTFEIGDTLALDASVLPSAAATAAGAQDHLALLLELPLRFGEQACMESLLQMIVERLIAVIPGAVRGALLLCDRPSGNLLLKAHLPAGRPAVSWTLAQRAIKEREAFIWSHEQDLNASLRELSSVCGMYAPLIWGDDVLGVVCVDNPHRERLFTEGDLRLLFAVARYAALAVAHLCLQQEMQQNSTLLSHLLTNFSPTLRERLLKKAREGKLRMGGEKSEVTMLCADIRGFTRLTENMDPHDILDLLNGYFPALVDAVFRFNGAIDKYVGDAILAVFGSPDPDAHQYENAIRAATDMQSAMKTINVERAARGLTTCQIGIGIHCGEVLHGFVGSMERIEFTVLGDVVNKTARYCDGAKGGEILISPKLHEYMWRTVRADTVSIASKHEGTLPAYSVTGLKTT